jgi:hypothetical protein
MIEDIDSRRCLSKVVVTNNLMKRCIRHAGHNEAHVWFEDENRTEGLPRFVRWDFNSVRYFEYRAT